MDIAAIYNLFKETTGICTDTRAISQDCMFVALKGANFNGNTFAAQALENGAKYVIVDEAEYKVDDRCVLVADALETLQELAKYKRSLMTIPVVGLTGSNGKTTTKEFIATALSAKFKVFATQGNLNNHIGVPITILSIPDDCEVAVIEMGANHIGEIGFLCEISQPTHGMITNIGKAHLKGFGSFEGVARAKSEIYLYLLKNGGEVFVNASNEHLARMATRFEKVNYYLGKGGYELTLVSQTPYLSIASTSGYEVQTKIYGRYNFENIVAAVAIATFLGVDEDKALDKIGAYVSTNNRSQIVELGSNTVVLDAYNANPTSMTAAIKTFAELDGDEKLLVLGDMYELGEESEKEHLAIVNMCEDLSFDDCVFVGEHFSAVANNFGTYYINREEFIADGGIKGSSNTLILIKGSRGVGLEKVLEDAK